MKVNPIYETEKVPLTQSMMESSSSSGEVPTILPNTGITTSTEATAAKRSRRKTISDSTNSLSGDTDDSLIPLSSCCASLTIPAPPPLNQRLINSINFHSVYHSITPSNILSFNMSKSQALVPFTQPGTSDLEDEVDNTILQNTSDNV